MQGIWGLDTHVLFVGDGGRISHLDLGTNVMSSLPSPTQTRLFAAWGSSAQDVWIVGERELIMHGALK